MHVSQWVPIFWIYSSLAKSIALRLFWESFIWSIKVTFPPNLVQWSNLREEGEDELVSIMAAHFFPPYLIHLILSAPPISIEPQWVRSQYAPWMVNWKDLSNKGGQLSMWQGAVTHILDLRFSNPPSNLLAFYPHTGCRKYDIIKYPFQPRISYILYHFWL